MAAFQKLVSPLQSAFGFGRKPAVAPRLPRIPQGVVLEEQFPEGFHVYGFTQGPAGGNEVMIGAGNPATALGAVFIGTGEGPWKQIDLPEETALLSQFIRLKDGRYVAGGMSSIGRGAILTSDPSGTEWKPVDLDLHAYCAISSLIEAPDGSLIASTGQMITQGKTKPVFFRSTDQGATWQKETFKLPIALFQTLLVAADGTIYAGTTGDVMPALYRSKDSGRTWEAMPPFPMYKTYKMPALHFVKDGGAERLYVVLWGYKSDIADRVVRIYASTPDLSGWEELPLIDDSHFVFSFYVSRDRTFYIGSEKGRVYRSTDLGKSWKPAVTFSTNIGAYAIHEDSAGRIWLGKDFVAPDDYSLWRLT